MIWMAIEPMLNASRLKEYREAWSTELFFRRLERVYSRVTGIRIG
jgi:hypothetical protein